MAWSRGSERKWRNNISGVTTHTFSNIDCPQARQAQQLSIQYLCVPRAYQMRRPTSARGATVLPHNIYSYCERISCGDMESVIYSRNSRLGRDFPRPPGEWRPRRNLWAPSAPPLGRLRHPFGKPPPSAAVK